MRRWRVAALVVVVAALVPLAPILLKGELPSFRDHEDYFVPLRAFTADAIMAGELPLWNPFNASGEAWLANPQTGVFYPPAWLVALLPFRIGYVAFLMFHLVVLGLGLRRLLLRWSSDESSTLVASAFVVSGPFLSLLDVSNNLATIAWTPWLIARALDRDRTPGAVDSILLALTFLGGEPLLAIVTWLVWIFVVMFRLGRKALPLVAWLCLMAVGLCAAQLIPFAEMLIGSDRVGGLDPDLAFQNSLAIGDWLAVLVSPAGVQPGIGGSQLFLPSLYVSPIIILLGLASFSREVDSRVRGTWLAVLLVSMVLASGSQFPMIGWVLEGLHLTVSRYPVKLALFGFIAIGVLCAIGFDRLHGLSTRERVSCGLVAAGVVVAAQIIHRSAFAPIAMTGMVVGGLWLLGFLAMLWFARRFHSDARLLLASVLLPVVVFDSVAASRFMLRATQWPYPAPYSSVLKDDQRVMRLEQLDQARTGAAHVRDRGAWMGGYLNLLSGQHDASTAAPVVDRRYQRLHDTALAAPRMDLLDFLSVRYLLTERDLSSFGYPRIAEHDGVSVYERDSARPFLTAEFTPRAIQDEEAAYEELTEEPSASKDRRVLAVGLTGDYPSRTPDGATMYTRSLQFTRQAVRAEVEVTHRALLVLNQRNGEGWSVSVDTKPREIVSANALFRGVEIEAGRHDVEFRYRPASVRAGIFVTFAAMFALAFEWWRLRNIRKKMSRSFHSEHA